MESQLQLYQTIYTICLVSGIIMTVLTTVMFFAFKIYKVIGDMTGVSQRKEIKQMQSEAAFTSQLDDKGKKKNKMVTPSGRLNNNMHVGMTSRMANLRTAIIQPPEPPAKPNNQTSANTSVLDESLNGTQVLSVNETSNGNDSVKKIKTAPSKYYVRVERKIIMTHSDEKI